MIDEHYFRRLNTEDQYEMMKLVTSQSFQAMCQLQLADLWQQIGGLDEDADDLVTQYRRIRLRIRFLESAQELGRKLQTAQNAER